MKKIKNLAQLIFVVSQQSIIRSLNNYFQKINLMFEDELIALYNTTSTLIVGSENSAISEEEHQLFRLVVTIKKAIIARMMELIRKEEEKVEKNLMYYTVHRPSLEILDRQVNGPLESKIKTMKRKFYAITGDAAFYQP